MKFKLKLTPKKRGSLRPNRWHQLQTNWNWFCPQTVSFFKPQFLRRSTPSLILCLAVSESYNSSHRDVITDKGLTFCIGWLTDWLRWAIYLSNRRSLLQLFQTPNCSAVGSVNRFGKILPLWWNFKCLWQFFERLFSILRSFVPTLAKF